VKGRFTLHKINDKEASFKLCRVVQVGTAKKATIGRNPFVNGALSAIPYVVTHDGRTIRYPDPLIKVSDTVKFDLTTGKIVDFAKFDLGNMVMITRGANIGRIGVIANVEKHQGSHTIVHIKDKNDHQFATRAENVFVIGKGTNPLISLPRDKGVKKSVLEERSDNQRRAEKNSKKAAKVKA
jgi:small subunit ribosomal protein S4e